MNETNPTSTPSPSGAGSESRSAAGPDNTSSGPSGKSPKRGRRRWLKVVGSILLLLILLVLLIPTIASSAAARGYVLGKVNEHVNGHVQVDDWSLGWSGNFRLDGLRVTDSAGSQILQLAHLTAHPSLWSVIRGHYDLGKIVVDGLDFNVVREKDGTLNFAKLAKSESKRAPSGPAPAPAEPNEDKHPPAAKSEPTKLPDVRAELVLQNCKGTIEDRQAGQMAYLLSLDCDINVPDINQPITESIKAVLALGQNAPGTISIEGQTLLVKNNQLLADPAQILSDGTVEQKVSLANVDLASIAPFLGTSGIDRLGGIVNGQEDIVLKPNQDGVFHGQLSVSGLSVGMNKQVVLADDALNFQTAGSFASSGGTKSVRFSQLDLVDKQGLLGIKQTTPDGLRVGLAADGALHPAGGLELSYDLAKLWKVAFPLLSPSTQESLKEIQVAGQYTKRISVAGSYPAGVPANVAFRSIQSQLGLTVGSLTGKGLDIRNFDLPMLVRDGKVLVALSDKPGDYPQPAYCNGGQISLGGATLDMSGDHPRLSMVPATALMKNVSINPALASAMGKSMGNFLFAEASGASGLLDVTINRCERQPLDNLMNSTGKENDGVMEVVVAIQNVDLAGPNISRMFGSLTSALQGVGGKINTNFVKGIRGGIKNYTIRVQNGVTTHDMNLTLTEKERPLHLAGTMGLQKQDLHMTLQLPWKLLGVNEQLMAGVMPNGIQLPVGGTVSAPEFDAGAAIQKNLFQSAPADLLKNLPGLLGQKKSGDKGSGASSDQTQPASPESGIDLLGNFLNKDKKKDKK